MHKSATKCNEILGKWCKNKHGASKIIDTFETYHRPCSELKAFFEKAKRYAPGIVSMISPLAAPAAVTTPISLTLTTSGSVPPPNAGAASATPTSAADREAEVA
jgi:hypothetical protein